ncbi:hypothetical protein Ahy_A04g020137 isoform B [Arachis hypogaea]|uniref:Protein kinase domain-containing protein n=1 Tax=Arachis hypogaea TaxID=3818 RepID=A0A445DHA3_ARAHY|nr:hypothetical protein Ahy_A04g020137 isoform B [Arachis hypogaea]
MKTDNFKPLPRCDDTLESRWRTEMVVTMNRDISTEQRSMLLLFGDRGIFCEGKEKRREEMLNIKRVLNAVSNYQKRGGGEATHPVGGCGYSCLKTAAFKVHGMVLDYCHSQGIMHLDAMSLNVMVDPKQRKLQFA